MNRTHCASDIAAAVLASLPQITPARLRALFECFGDPVATLDAVRAGRAGQALARIPRRDATKQVKLAAMWRGHADPAGMARQLMTRGTFVWRDGTSGYPITDEVPNRPAVLLAEGDRPDVLERPRVAVVGTRTATPHGLADGRELGAFLAEAGVTVVSGLAIGIDGAAHVGALEVAPNGGRDDGGGVGAGVVGVVATGLDIEYPRRHVALYRKVRNRGVVLGETGFGVRPAATRFPVRNRIIAALADVIVVVEATTRGGARITAQYGLEYGRTVMAVPGSRRNPAAAGTNALIADGAHPLVEWSDVLLALGMSPGARRCTATRLAPDPEGAALLRALGGEAATPDQIAGRTGFTPEQVAVSIAELERTGLVERSQGCIWPMRRA